MHNTDISATLLPNPSNVYSYLFVEARASKGKRERQDDDGLSFSPSLLPFYREKREKERKVFPLMCTHTVRERERERERVSEAEPRDSRLATRERKSRKRARPANRVREIERRILKAVNDLSRCTLTCV